MGKKIRGAALRAKKRGKAAQLDLVDNVAHEVETGHVTSKKNEELFMLDTTAALVPKEQEPKRAKASATRKPRIVDEKVQALLEKHDAAALQKMATKIKTNNKRKAFDLWQEEETTTAAEPLPKRLAGVAPPRTQTKAARAVLKHKATTVAVEVAQSGQSYHPDPHQHQNVIGEALALELRRMEAEEYRNTPLSTGMSEETKALLMGDYEDESSSDDEDDDDDDTPTVLHKQKEKLTRAQRNRQKRIRAQQKNLQGRKMAKKRLNAIADAKTLSKQLAKKEALQKERKEHVASLKKEQTRTLGTSVLQHVSKKNPIHAPTLPVALSSDLSGALRTIKPKGSLLTDRMESFKDRNMAPAKHVGDRKCIVQGNKRRKLKVKAKGHDIHVKDERGQDYLLMG